MIVIVSENTDGSTTDVLKWLKKEGYGDRTLRINIEDKVYLDEFNLTDDSLVIEHRGKKLDLAKEASVIWFRRGNIRLNLKGKKRKRSDIKLFTNEESNEEIIEHLRAESKELIEAVNTPDTTLIGGYNKGRVNKILVLQQAKKVGLDIPQTVIIDSKERLAEFYNEQDEKIITKGIADTLSFENDRVGYVVYTNAIDEEKLQTLPTTFFPSLFQGNVEKVIELRVFFWFGKMYSMAIFSQLDEQTNTDFRIYNREKPNRMIPYQLPLEIEEKSRLLMDKIGLKTGSIDFILDDKGRYVFLEVNPVGQFGMVSVPCNYQVEKEIAKTLISYEDEFQKN